MGNKKVITIKPSKTKGEKPLIILSAKVSRKAVERNKIKRRIKDIIKEYSENFPRGCKIIVGPGAVNLSYQELKEEINKQLNGSLIQ